VLFYLLKISCTVLVGTAIRYGMDGPGIEFQWGEIFRTVQTGPWGPPSLLYNGYRVSFPGRGIDHLPPVLSLKIQ